MASPSAGHTETLGVLALPPAGAAGHSSPLHCRSPASWHLCPAGWRIRKQGHARTRCSALPLALLLLLTFRKENAVSCLTSVLLSRGQGPALGVSTGVAGPGAHLCWGGAEIRRPSPCDAGVPPLLRASSHPSNSAPAGFLGKRPAKVERYPGTDAERSWTPRNRSSVSLRPKGTDTGGQEADPRRASRK